MKVVEPNTRAATPEIASGPYKFLDYYVEADRPRFSGRDRDIREVVSRLMTDRACILYGRSGLGKTSLVLAGVFPELRARGFLPVHARVLESPLPDACKAVAEMLNLGIGLPADELLSSLEALTPRPRIVLALDQFEEFFIRFGKRPRERKAFTSWLAAITSSEGLDFRVLISLREEYLSRLDEFTSDLPEMFGSEYRLRPLTAFGARQAIIRPLIEADIEYDQKLVNKIVDMLAAEDFDSLLLQIVCSAVYREARDRSNGSVRLKESDLQSIGGLEGILRRFLDDVTAKIDSEHILLCRTILDALITSEGTKRAVTLQALLQADFTATQEEVQTLLEFLERSRLVRGEMRSGQMWYELTHERLVRHILDWFKLDSTFADFRAARELIASACRGDRGERFRERLDTLLARGHIEGVIRPFRERLRLDPLQLEFVFWSAVYHMVPDVAFWAKTWGYENSASVLVKLAGRGQDETARKAAMYAVTAIPGPRRELVELCKRLVIDDASSEVRRTAGKSLAKIAEPNDITELAQMTKDPVTRGAAREALADIFEAGRPLDGVPFLARRRAKKIVMRRRYRLHAEAIRERGRTGAITGVLAGCGWVCTVGLIITLAISWLGGGIPIYGRLLPSSADLQIWAYVVPGVLLLAAFAGWKSCRRAARRTAYADQDRFFYSLGRKRTLIWCSVLLFGILGMAGFKPESELQFYSVVAIFGGLLALLILAITGQIALTRWSVWPGVPQREVFFWALLQSLGLPLLVSGALTLELSRSERFAERISDPDRSGIWFIGTAFGILLSFATFILIVALTRAEVRHPIGVAAPVELRQRSLARWLAGLSAGAFFLWFGVTFLPTSAPFLASKIDSGSAGRANQKLQATWPNSRFLLFPVREPEDQWYRVAAAPGNAVLSLKSGTLQLGQQRETDPTRELVLFLPEGPTHENQLVALSLSKPPGEGEDKSLDFYHVPVLTPSSTLALGKQTELRQIAFEQSPDNPELWSAEFSGQLAKDIPTKDQTIRLSVLQLAATLPGQPARATAKLSAQFVEKPTCSLSAIASFDLPESPAVLAFSLNEDKSRGRSTNAYSYSATEQKFLEIPVDADNSFHAHLALSLPGEASTGKPPNPAAAVAATLGEAEKKVPEPVKHEQKKLTLAVTLELAPFEDTQKETLALLQQRRYSEAVTAARMTLRKYPDDDCSENNLAWALLKNGQFEEALAYATKAVEADPTRTAHQDTLAHAAYGAGQWSVAAEAWERAIALDPAFMSRRTEPDCKRDALLLADAQRRAAASH